MKPIKPRVFPALVLASAAAADAAAQSLVEIARQERLRREEIARRAGPDAPPPRVYADADLIHRGLLTMRVDAAAPDAAAGSEAAPEAPADPAAADTGSVDDERQWRERMTAARQALERAERRAAELQTRVNGLWADFTSRDDPAQRAAVEQDRLAALAALEETRAEIDELARAVADVRREARRAGVPPGWLRGPPAAAASVPPS